MPNAKLVKHIEDLVEQNEDVKAIDIVRSLLLRGHLNPSDFKKGANIGTLQFGSYVLAEPEEVGKVVADSKKEVIATRDGTYATIVLHFKSDVPPKTVEGKSGGLTPVGVGVGGAVNEDADAVRTLTERLIVHGSANTTIRNFFKAVAAVLGVLRLKDPSRYKRAKFYMAANPILSWFFLTMPGYHGALVHADDIKGLKWEHANVTIIKEAEQVDYLFNKNLMLAIKSHRTSPNDGDADRASLPSMIYRTYEVMLPELLKAKAIDEHLARNVNLKIRMDELRHMNEDKVESWEDIDETIAELGRVENYIDPKAQHVYCDSQVYSQQLIKGKEAYLSGPAAFVMSPYFVYMPLNPEVEQQLSNLLKRGGGIVGGNPATLNTVVFSGGAAREAYERNVADDDLTSLVQTLTHDQREQLKELLTMT